MRHSPLAAAVAVAAAAVLLVGRALHAQTTTAPKVLWACYVPGSGTTYRIRETDLRQTCTKDFHVMFSWNETGPQGPAGPQGVKGDAGPAGPQGPAGPAGAFDWSQLYTATATRTAYAKDVMTLELQCPTGKQVLSGGFSPFTTDGLHVVGQYFDYSRRLFAVRMANEGDTSVPVYLSIGCI